jgi:predicted N-acetyltransferase YhbS
MFRGGCSTFQGSPHSAEYMRMAISVRPESAEDIGAIHSLTREAFRNAEHTSSREQFITDALRNAGKLTISLVAVDQGEIVGHLAMSPVTLSDGTAGWYGLGPVAVSPARQSEGIGTLLILRALETLRQQGAQGCVVLGEPKYYSRFGFDTTASLILPGVPAKYFQALVFVGQIPSAQVRYHDSFDS